MARLILSVEPPGLRVVPLELIVQERPLRLRRLHHGAWRDRAVAGVDTAKLGHRLRSVGLDAAVRPPRIGVGLDRHDLANIGWHAYSSVTPSTWNIPNGPSFWGRHSPTPHEKPA